MKSFLKTVNDYIGELESKEAGGEMELRMTAEYQRLSEKERESCLAILDEVLDVYLLKINIFSTLLCALKDKKILPYIEKTLADSSYPLWDRIHDFWQWNMSLFLYPALYEQRGDYRSRRDFYGCLSEEIRNLAGKPYSYLPYRSRAKRVVITVMQLLSENHAPTNIVRYFYKCLQDMGYDVICFVAFADAADGCWTRSYGRMISNFCHQTMPFQYAVGGG